MGKGGNEEMGCSLREYEKEKKKVEGRRREREREVRETREGRYRGEERIIEIKKKKNRK